MGAFGILLILGFNAMIGYDLLRDHQDTLQSAHDETQSLSVVLERHATDSFAGVDKILAGLAEVLSVRDDTFQRADPDIHALLRRQAALSPLTRAILFIGADGQLLHDSDAPQPASLNLSDRDYVIVHKEHRTVGASGAARAYVGLPVRGRTSGTWFVSMSRRFETPDGRFAGVIVAIVEPIAFRRFYETLRLGHDSIVTLFHTDGQILARHPDHDANIGRSALNNPLFTTYLKSAAEGTREYRAPGEDQPRILSYRRSSDFPIVVDVSVTREAVLAPWRKRAFNAALVLAAGNGMLALLILLLLRGIGQRERMLADLQSNERALRASQTRLIADIAARHRVEAELIAAKQASDDANQAKTQFLANMSHELRTPLNAIIGFSEALLTGIFGPMATRQADYVGDIRRSGLHLLSLINDILDTTKIECGKYSLHEESLSVRDLALHGLRQIEPLAGEKGIALAVQVPSSLPRLWADERAMTQVLLNLLSNAVKFTPAGGRTSLTASLTAEGALRLQVADTGIGIPAADLQRVLEPFQQVENVHTRRYPGTGLGLPLVKSLVELHGGRFTLESEPGEGTTATVTLPAFRVRASVPVAVAAP
ncbi:sensor histidine kinase [Azospirillum rugosum]|uniref:histidine kinase n=1 Tax=Azospirillum rugosum TaxID=416170 RepID=A0ABS4SE58_9PROT|nr:ATP-binding protein [Azospirillum rugosum]MBP2290348.1 signal transduction histidine kinase [Azospirillum rugosum]MDQ0527824.1 signal transduction histidine kinase [Azospirillum rugosum]